MACVCRMDCGVCGSRPLRRFVTAVFVAVCLVGPAMARTWDAAPVRIVSPPGNNVDSGTVVTPSAVVINHGDSTASFPALFSIGTFYVDTQHVTGLAHGDSAMVTFTSWTALQRGVQTARCSTALATDESTANDRISRLFNVRVRDVGVDSIVAPVGIIDSALIITPQAQVTNSGTGSANFIAKFRIGASYVCSVYVMRLASHDSRVVSFANWAADTLGRFGVSCTTALNYDADPSNDVAYDSVQVSDVGISETDPSPRLPRTVVLSSIGPSVLAGRVSIMYGLPRSTDARLEVYDACGRSVQVLAAGIGRPGYHTAVWKCTDEHGRAVAEGAYFVRLVADGATLTSKVVKTE